MSDSPLVVERAAGVAQLRFNRPDVLNALDAGLANALLEACRSIASDSAVRVVVLGGNGRAFMAGGDLAAMRRAPVEAADALIRPLHAAVQLLSEMPVPVLASVHGAAAGAGISLMLAADLAIAAEGTRFNFAYTDIAASCDGGASWALPRLLGLRKALEIALLCESFDATEALRLGLLEPGGGGRAAGGGHRRPGRAPGASRAPCPGPSQAPAAPGRAAEPGGATAGRARGLPRLRRAARVRRRRRRFLRPARAARLSLVPF